MSTTRYRLYGLTVGSPWTLPCPRADDHQRADVRLQAGTRARFSRARLHQHPSHRSEDWFRCRRLPDGTTYLRWTGLFEFLISANGRTILYNRLDSASQESFNVYLLGQVISFSLLAFGLEPLHGTAVVVDGGAIAFLGNCGYGKSTLGAAFLARGFPVLTDDLVVLKEGEEGWSVHRGIPRIKLFPAMARRVLRSHSTGTPMNNGTPKLVLPLKGPQIAGDTVPLRALYVLSDPKRRERTRQEVRIEALSGGEAFLELLRAAFNLIVIDRERLATQFAIGTRLAGSIPVRRLIYPRKVSTLPDVCDAVLADLKTQLPHKEPATFRTRLG